MLALLAFTGSQGWSLARNVSIVVLVLFWLATGYWTFKDARRRIGDPWLVGLATAIGFFPPFLGPIIYMFFRPPEYLQDTLERELEIKAMEERIAQLDQRCPVCRARVEPSFLVCPVCTTRLKQACVNCGQPLDSLWQVCPHCATPVTPALPLLEDVSSRELPRPSPPARLPKASD
jgi:Double zinc ribbon